ncbi:cytochrome-c peroxidase [Pseudomonas sp. MT3]|uniref:cytochrome-c peroxidase n=1 Tax=Pseudomonas sp. ATCC 13867 TaxID=1294143 RepID=UPI0002C4E401|nr:cytochrome-c peroxidase [Pseudomonas sp. ATCC 13867]AGI22795.1 cytochrome c551 peroxidase [Pseudomonas sp. ATCC 13867]RFQ29475.1 cytochrome-c peroxidase [Pseudomonas sp. ATCC 13867]
MQPLKWVLGSLVMLASTSAAHADALRDHANGLFKPIPEQASDTLDPNQVELGRQLFFEPRLSASHVISCNTCHNVGTGGADNVPASSGHAWQKGARNSPTVFNAVFNVAQFWDGRAKDLEEQAKGPVQNPVEMHNTPNNVEATLRSMPEYVASFEKAFPSDKQPVSFDNMARALQAFESTLITPDSRFDLYLKGDDNALDAREKKGLQTFMSSGCISCHNGVNLGGQAYFPFGLVKKPDGKVLPSGDKGRFEVTKTQNDAYVFRAAPLRNVALTAPYFHSGQVWDLEEAVAIMGTAQLGKQLNTEEVGDIVAFLKTVTGKQPKVEYPLLPPSTATTPRPVD